MLEGFIIKLIDSIVFEDSQSWLKNATEKFKQIYKNRLLEYYHEKTSYYARFKTIIRKDSPLLFKDVYLKQRIKKNRGSQIYDIDKPSEFFRKNKYSLVIGEAGSGKSTLVKYMFLECIKEANSIPILIELRDLNPFGGDIEEYIFKEIFENKIATSKNILLEQLERGKFIFFLDGYDETDSNKSFAHKLSHFINENDKNSFFITSRPGANIEFINLTSTYKILPIEDHEIPVFVSKQSLDKKLEQDIIRSIQDNKERYISEFLGNPLLLLIYILTFRSNPKIPHQRSTFYRRVIDTLFIEHDSTKLGYKRLFESSLSQEQLIKILESFSMLSFFENKFEFRKEYVFEKFDLIKEITSIKFDINKVIVDLVKSTSIWQEDVGVFSFVHRSLQEYLTALYIKNLDQETKIEFFNATKNLIISNKFDVKEIKNLFDLYYELDGYSYYKYFIEPIILEIESKVQKYKNPASVIPLLYDRVSVITKDEDNLFISGGKRTFKYFITRTSLYKILEVLIENRLNQFDFFFKKTLIDHLAEGFKIYQYSNDKASVKFTSRKLQNDLYPLIDVKLNLLVDYISMKSKIIKKYIENVENSNRQLINILKKK